MPRGHVIRFDPAGWVLRHPLTCRLPHREGLFRCPVNLAVRSVEEPPGGRYGYYSVIVTDGARPHYEFLRPLEEDA